MLANKIGGPAGNRLSRCPDIRNQGNLYPIYGYKFGNISLMRADYADHASSKLIGDLYGPSEVIGTT